MLGVFALRLVLRRFDDHPGDFGAVGGRGADHGQRRRSSRYVIPIAIAILVGLFAIQSRGTAKVGLMFGPVMLVYFVDPGCARRDRTSSIIRRSCWRCSTRSTRSTFSWSNRCRAFIAMGSVVLAVTGAEALYADMGHFGRRPIKYAWLYFVMPALLLNYHGAGGDAAVADPGRGAGDGQEPVLLPRARRVPPAAGDARHRGDDHRQPGGDFGRFLGHPAGDPAGLHPAPAHHPHQRDAPPARSTFRWSIGR